MNHGRPIPNFKNEIWTDLEVAAVMHISLYTFRKRCKNPVKGEFDINAANPYVFGGRRFWRRRDVLDTLGLDESCAEISGVESKVLEGGCDDGR